MNNRKIIYITQKALSQLPPDVPIYVLIDPDCNAESSIDIVSKPLENENDLGNLFEKSEDLPEEFYYGSETNGAYSLNSSDRRDSLVVDSFDTFNDEFINTVDIITTDTENAVDPMKTPEYLSLFHSGSPAINGFPDYYDESISNNKNTSFECSDTDDGITAAVSKTLESFRSTSTYADAMAVAASLSSDESSERKDNDENGSKLDQSVSCVHSEYECETLKKNVNDESLSDLVEMDLPMSEMGFNVPQPLSHSLSLNIPTSIDVYKPPPYLLEIHTVTNHSCVPVSCAFSMPNTNIPPPGITWSFPCTITPPDTSKPPPFLMNENNNASFINQSVVEPLFSNERAEEIRKIKNRRQREAETEPRKPISFQHYEYVFMDINEKFLVYLNKSKKKVVGTKAMKDLEDEFQNEILNRRLDFSDSENWTPLDRTNLTKENDICQSDDESSFNEEESNLPETDKESILSDCTKSDSEDECFVEPANESGFTKHQLTQLAQIERKVDATRRRLNLQRAKQQQQQEPKNDCNYNCRKRPRCRSPNHQVQHNKKPKQSTGYLTIQEDNLHNNAPVISGGRTLQQQAEISHKLKHPNKLHPDIWYNVINELNDGPACSCELKYQIGPLHNDFSGEAVIPLCQLNSNNYGKLYHYRMVISPPTNFLSQTPTTIKHKGKSFAFGGFSVFTHKPLIEVPPCQIVRYNIVYYITLVEEDFPIGFTVRSLNLISDYLYSELLELLDMKWWPSNVDQISSCRVIHLLPRFERPLSKKGVKLLSTDVILKWLIDNGKEPLFEMLDLPRIHAMSQSEWSEYIDPLRGTLASFPGKKPAAIRIDQIDRVSLQSKSSGDVIIFPVIVHMNMAPLKLSLTREPAYKRLLRNFLKLQYLILNRPLVTKEDISELKTLARLLENFEMNGIQRREFTVEISSDGFYRTCIRTDVVQFALLVPSVLCHIRFHFSLSELEDRLKYTFKDKSLLHQALTHPSYRNTNYGTNPDHYQNSMTTCGLRHIEYGDKFLLYRSFRKKGLSKMVNVMSHMPFRHETRSSIFGNERLECLGDAVIELITSVHLFYMFPELSEGHLDAFRQALVQNHYLADLSVRLGFHKFLLYTHNTDFSYDSTITHARSDAFEAVMAAVTLDGGLDEADRIFGSALFGDDQRIHRVWCELPIHPLQEQFPKGDRHVIQNSPIFQNLTKLEERLGIHFNHIRLLAKAMTIRKTGFNFFTLGDNQRLEFLGDSLLKYVTTDYLFKHFPRHHEGHISLLRNTLVNRFTQAKVCRELGLDEFIIRKDQNKAPQLSLKINQKPNADLLEAFLGALFVDKDLTWVERFCQICFWPRLVEFILRQSWNDPKSRLQQCCLTYRSLNEDPEIAHYRLISTFGSTDNREFKVGVYFRGVRLATGFGSSIQAAEMNAATMALDKYKNDFKQLGYQEKVINDHYDPRIKQKILDQYEKWDSELVDNFLENPTPKPMHKKLAPDSSKEWHHQQSYHASQSSSSDARDKVRSISLTSSLGELLKNVKK